MQANEAIYTNDQGNTVYSRYNLTAKAFLRSSLFVLGYFLLFHTINQQAPIPTVFWQDSFALKFQSAIQI